MSFKASTSAGLPACIPCGWRPSEAWLEYQARFSLSVLRPKNLGLMVRCPECWTPIHQILIAGTDFPFPVELLEGTMVFADEDIVQAMASLCKQYGIDLATWNSFSDKQKSELFQTAERLLVLLEYERRAS